MKHVPRAGVALAEPPSGPVLRPLAEVLPAAVEPEPTGERPDGAQQPDSRGPALAESVLRAAVEFIAGHRPARQLATILAPHVMTHLTGLRSAAGALRPRVQVVRSQQPVPGAVEATAVVRLRTGTRAVSARFELREQHWRCVALHLPLTRGDLVAARRAR